MAFVTMRDIFGYYKKVVGDLNIIPRHTSDEGFKATFGFYFPVNDEYNSWLYYSEGENIGNRLVTRYHMYVLFRWMHGYIGTPQFIIDRHIGGELGNRKIAGSVYKSSEFNHLNVYKMYFTKIYEFIKNNFSEIVNSGRVRQANGDTDTIGWYFVVVVGGGGGGGSSTIGVAYHTEDYDYSVRMGVTSSESGNTKVYRDVYVPYSRWRATIGQYIAASKQGNPGKNCIVTIGGLKSDLETSDSEKVVALGGLGGYSSSYIKVTWDNLRTLRTYTVGVYENGYFIRNETRMEWIYYKSAFARWKNDVENWNLGFRPKLRDNSPLSKGTLYSISGEKGFRGSNANSFRKVNLDANYSETLLFELGPGKTPEYGESRRSEIKFARTGVSNLTPDPEQNGVHDNYTDAGKGAIGQVVEFYFRYECGATKRTSAEYTKYNSERPEGTSGSAGLSGGYVLYKLVN